MRVNLRTLGCRLNEAEVEGWARQFRAEGYRIVGDDEEADLLVFNSCAVTQDAVRKSRHLLRKAGREQPAARIILSGCYASLQPEEAASLGIDLVVDNRDKHRLVELARAHLPPARVSPLASPDTNATSALFSLGRHRAFIKVQDGCRHRCTYCIVTVARGEERSRTPEDIIEDIKQQQAGGIQEAVLTGVHLGGYGSDSGSRLSELIRRILRETRIPRLRLGSLEPWDIGEDFIELFADPRLMPHLHLPLQSGSDSVLKRMARRGRTADYARLIARLRAAIPNLNLSTDLIVGFPGETEAEWVETLAFAERMRFGHIHVFSFSPRPGTAAADMSGPVQGAVKKARSRALHALAERDRRAFAEGQVGATQPVLWEGTRQADDGTAMVFGYTPHYLKVGMAVTPARGAALARRITPVRLGGLAAAGDYLLGEAASG